MSPGYRSASHGIKEQADHEILNEACYSHGGKGERRQREVWPSCENGLLAYRSVRPYQADGTIIGANREKSRSLKPPPLQISTSHLEVGWRSVGSLLLMSDPLSAGVSASDFVHHFSTCVGWLCLLRSPIVLYPRLDALIPLFLAGETFNSSAWLPATAKASTTTTCGTKYAGECCGATYELYRQLDDGACDMGCTGIETEAYGRGFAMTVYAYNR